MKCFRARALLNGVLPLNPGLSAFYITNAYDAVPTSLPYWGALSPATGGAVTGEDLHWVAYYWTLSLAEQGVAGTSPTSMLFGADIDGDHSVAGLDLQWVATNWLLSWTNTPPPG